jgi:GT2 family glycosyltransferase
MGERLTVVVTDNRSPDDSVRRIRAAVEGNGWGEWVRVMPLARNGGFAYGNNEAIRDALAAAEAPDYVHLLNPDTVVHPGGVRELVEFLDANPRVGIAGSRLENPDGTAQPSANRFHSVFGEINTGLRLGVVTRLLSKYEVAPPPPAGSCATDWVSGASFMVRSGVFRRVGLLDERYFMYYEETDFCLRAARAGWECWYVPGSRVVHLQGQATGGAGGKRVPSYFFDSRRWYFVKNHGRVRAALADAAYAGTYALWRVRRWAQRKPDTDPPRLLSDFLKNSVFVKGFRCV